MLKKLLIYLMILATLLTVLVGCQNEQTPNGEETVTDSSEETKKDVASDEEFNIESFLPSSLNFDKAEVMIHVRGDGNTVKEIGLEEDGSALSSELFERTGRTEERLNVVLAVANAGNSYGVYNAQIAAIRNSIQQGFATYDLIAGWSPRIPVLASEGLFYNLNMFEFFESSHEWWSQSLAKELCVNERLYMATGDVSLEYMDDCHAIIFNQTMASAYGYNYSTFYEIVSQGEWTLDYLYELSKNVYDNKNGNDAVDAGDAFGFIYSGTLVSQAFYGSCGVKVIENNGTDRPTLNFDVSFIQSAYEKVRLLMIDNPGAQNVDAFTGVVLTDYFSQGNGLFMLGQLGSLYELNDMSGGYGVLPTPKYNAEQSSYYSQIHACSLWSVPVDAKDPEMSAAVMTSLGYDSNRLVVEPHFEKVLKTRYVKDSESGYMIDTIYNNIFMNFDSIYNEVMGAEITNKATMPMFIFDTLLKKNDGSSVSSWWASNESTLRSKFETIVDGFYEG